MNFINLTNGIEAVSDLGCCSAVRIRSTTIEHKDWELLINDLDHNLLFHLSQGVPCHIYDFGTRRRTSKTIGVGIPLIKRLLEYVWLKKCSANPLFCLVKERLIDRAITLPAQNAKKKLCYYCKILNTNQIRLYGHSQTTSHDGDFAFYQELLHEKVAWRLYWL